jgi:hypothetical protein
VNNYIVKHKDSFKAVREGSFDKFIVENLQKPIINLQKSLGQDNISNIVFMMGIGIISLDANDKGYQAIVDAGFSIHLNGKTILI